MKTARVVINHPEQTSITREPGKELEQKQKGLKQRWTEEYELASKVDLGVPILTQQGGRWRV